MAAPRDARLSARRRHLAALLASVALVATAADDGLPPPTSPLKVDALASLVGWLEAAPAVTRLQFAAVALDELAASYADELASAARDPRSDHDVAATRRWRAAARTAIDQAHADAGALTSAPDIALFVDPGPTLRFVVQGRTVIVDAPRLSGPRTLYERIAGRFCAIAHCPDLFAPTPGAATATRSWANWSFGGAGTAQVETSSGLDFRFSDLEHMGTRKQAASALVQDLETLAQQLAWYRDHGTRIEWPALHIATLADGDAVLVVNSTGEYLRITPTAQRLPRGPLVSWLSASLDGRRFRYVFEHAETLFDVTP